MKAHRFIFKLLKMNNFTDNHFHEAPVYSYTAELAPTIHSIFDLKPYT